MVAHSRSGTITLLQNKGSKVIVPAVSVIPKPPLLRGNISGGARTKIKDFGGIRQGCCG